MPFGFGKKKLKDEAATTPSPDHRQSPSVTPTKPLPPRTNSGVSPNKGSIFETAQLSPAAAQPSTSPAPPTPHSSEGRWLGGPGAVSPLNAEPMPSPAPNMRASPMQLCIKCKGAAYHASSPNLRTCHFCAKPISGVPSPLFSRAWACCAIVCGAPCTSFPRPDSEEIPLYDPGDLPPPPSRSENPTSAFSGPDIQPPRVISMKRHRPTPLAMAIDTASAPPVEFRLSPRGTMMQFPGKATPRTGGNTPATNQLGLAHLTPPDGNTPRNALTPKNFSLPAGCFVPDKATPGSSPSHTPRSLQKTPVLTPREVSTDVSMFNMLVKNSGGSLLSRLPFCSHFVSSIPAPGSLEAACKPPTSEPPGHGITSSGLHSPTHAWTACLHDVPAVCSQLAFWPRPGIPSQSLMHAFLPLWSQELYTVAANCADGKGTVQPGSQPCPSDNEFKNLMGNHDESQQASAKVAYDGNANSGWTPMSGTGKTDKSCTSSSTGPPPVQTDLGSDHPQKPQLTFDPHESVNALHVSANWDLKAGPEDDGPPSGHSPVHQVGQASESPVIACNQPCTGAEDKKGDIFSV
eukprot:gene2824-79_t